MGDWLDGLGALASEIGADIVAVIQYLIGVLVAVFNYLYTLLAAVFQFFDNLMQKIGAFFTSIWNDWLKGIFADLWKAIVKVHAWLEKILSPIIKALTWLRKWVDWYFKTYVQPLLKIISEIRGFLTILRQFGVKWAAQLDYWLGQIQADIISAFTKVQGYINAIIGIVNSLADPLGLFRRPTFVMSMRRIFPSFARGMSGMPLGYFFPSPLKNAAAGWGAPPKNFTPTNAQMNPPPSSYFAGDDGLGDFGGWDGSDPLADSDADSMTPLDFFNDDAYPDPVVTDVPGTLAQLQQAAYTSVSQVNA